MTSPPLARDAFEIELRQVLAERYHDLHPFNLRMHEGSLGPEAIRTWVRNRYYYQTRIPIKDGLIVAKASDPDFRRSWVERIHDHDGREPGQGGLERWLVLAAMLLFASCAFRCSSSVYSSGSGTSGTGRFLMSAVSISISLFSSFPSFAFPSGF